MATDRLLEATRSFNERLLQQEPEPESQVPAASANGVTAIEAEFRPMQLALNEIQRHLVGIRSTQTELFSSAFGAAALRESLDEANAAVGEIAERLKSQLREIERELAEAERLDPGAKGSTAHRMRRNIHVTATVKLVNLMGVWQDLQLWFRQANGAHAQRQLLIAKPEATQEELTQVAEGSGEQIFARVMTNGNAAAAALADVQAKHAAIVQIERDVAAVAQLMVELAELVSEQGEVLDTIEGNVSPHLPLLVVYVFVFC